MGPVEWPKLMWITDGQGDAQTILKITQAAAKGGLRCVQLREPSWSDAEVEGMVGPLLELLGPRGLLLLNARPGVVLRMGDPRLGLHLPARCLATTKLDGALSERVIGTAVHDEEEISAAKHQPILDYLVLAPVLVTASKPGKTPLGLERARALTELAHDLPVYWLGGMGGELRLPDDSLRPAGIAVMSALSQSQDPRAAAFDLLRLLA